MKKTMKKALSVMLVVVIMLTAAPLSGFVGLELPEWLDMSIMSSAETSGTCGECGGTYEAVVTEPTCESAGYTTYTCLNCGDTYTADEVSAVGHSYVDGVCEYCGTHKTSFYLISSDENPTVGDKITVEVGILSNTGIGGFVIDIVYDSTVLKTLSVKSNPLVGTHNINLENKVRYVNTFYGELTETGTVLTIEFEVLNSNSCEMYIDFVEIFDDDYATVPVNSNVLYLFSSYCENDEHKYTTLLTEPTCTEQGYTTYICSLCGNSYVSNYVDALGYHSYNSFVTEPTCTEQGYTTYICSGCGDSYTTDEIAALGHNYVDGVCEYCGEVSDNPSGTCGENLTWSFDESTGTLTISGTGDMYNYLYITTDSRASWYPYLSEVTNIIIRDGVTSIGDTAFADGYNVIDVTIPDSVVYIGDTAFYRCFNLTNAEIPEGVQVIGDDAFCCCNSLTNVIIPESVTTIGEQAFRDCSNLTTIRIPENVTSIGDGAFSECNKLEYIEVSDNNSNYSSDKNGVLFDENKSTIIGYPAGGANEYVIPDTVVSIGDNSFHGCENLTDITISENVTNIGYMAFFGCTGLTNIIISNSVNALGYQAFDNCYNLEKIVINNFECEIPDSKYTIYSNAVIYGHENSTAQAYAEKYGRSFIATPCEVARVEVKNATCTEKGNIEHYYCPVCGLYYSDESCTTRIDETDVFIDELGHDYGTWIVSKEPTCTENGKQSRDCSRCDEAEIGVVNATGHTVGELTEEVLPTCTESGCTKGTCSVCGEEFENSVAALGHTYSDEWEITQALSCVTDEIKVKTCDTCGEKSGLVGITDEDFPKCIGTDYTHNMNTTFEAYSVPSACRIVLHFSADSYVESGFDYIYVYAGDSADEKNLVGKYTGSLAETIVNVDASTFTIRMTTDSSVTKYGFEISSIDYYSSDNVEITPATGHNYGDWEMVTEATCTTLGSRERVCAICAVKETETISSFGHTYESTVTAPTCTTSGYTTYTCSNCGDSYTTDEVPALGHNYVDGVCEYCGEGSENPSGTCGENITWTFDPSTGTLTISGIGTMANYASDNPPWESYEDDIISVDINNGVTTIGSYAFNDCQALTSVSIGSDITIIGEGAFAYCEGLTNVIIPDSVTTIGEYAFFDCTSLTTATIGNGVTTIGEGAFAECYSLVDITISNSVTTIADIAFAYCTSIVSITIPDSITDIGLGVFVYCGNLTNITVDSNNKCYSSDEYGVLYNKDKTTLISYPAGDVNTKYEIPNSVITIGEYAFACCESLIDVAIPDSVTSIGDYAFAECYSLLGTVIPDSVTTIGEYAFAYCEGLENATIPNSVTNIGEGAFARCKNLVSIIIPDSVVTMGNGVFANCENLTNVTIPDSITSISDYTFNYCTSLTDVYYSGTEEQWNSIPIGNYNDPLLNATIHYNSHSHIYEASVTVPTCTEQGYTTYTCSVCGDSYTSDYTEALGHTEAEAVEENYFAPTCTEKGSKELVVYCSVCGEEISRETIEIEALGHTYESTVIAPTCTEQGYTTYTCSVCDYSYNDDYTEALGHTEAKAVEENYLAPTCTEKGSKDLVVYCSVCSEEISRETIEIEALGHTYESTVIAPTCTEQGYTTYTCSVCDYSYNDDYTEALGHTEADAVEENYLAPTCTEKGSKDLVVYCSVCDDELSRETIEIEVLGHTYKSVVTAPTCTEQGYTTYTCTVCNYSYDDDFTDALGHTEADAVEENYLAPTCTEKGSKDLVAYCSVCGEELSRETIEIEALGHNYENTVIAPTCTEQGYTKYTCSVCSDSYNDNYTEAYGHNYNSTVTAPSCTEDGYTTYTCSACNDSYISDQIAAFGHNYNMTVVEATCTKQGYTKYVCSNCNDTYLDNYVDEKGHCYTATVTEATCTKQGYTFYVCSTCNDSYKDNFVEAFGHNLSDWEIIKSATILNEGERTRSCSACDYSEKEILNKITVDINSNENYGLANFTVVNAQTLEPIKNANIFVSTKNDGENTFTTDENGKVSIILPVGKQNISVYADGCLTRNLKITVSSGSNDIPQIGLSDKPIYEAEITSKEMTIEEIEAAGIDTSDPSNKHVYKYELKLEFKPEIDYYSIFYYMNGDDEIVGGGGTSTNTGISSSSTITWVPGSSSSTSSGTGSGGYFFIPATENEPSVKVYPVSEYFYLIIRGEVTWLKEMFDVEMLIINNSLTDTLEDLTATLSLPDGLSLATMTGDEQTLSQFVDKIAEGESKSVHWYVRGDKAGSYSLEARLQGMVMPFEEPIDDIFVAENQLNVWAGDAMHLDFEFPNAAYYGEDYPITITLTNVSDKTLYNVHHMVQIEQGMEIYYSDGSSKTKVETSDWVSKGVEKFNPGDKIVIETSVNIFFESEIMERELEKLIGIVDGIEQLINGMKAVQAGLDIAGSLIDCVGGCVSALDDFNFSSGSDNDKLVLFKELYNEISNIYTSYSTSGNKTFDAAVGVFNSGLNASLNAITSDPDEWLQNHSVDDIKSLLKDVKSLGSAISSDSSLSKKFNIFDSIRTAISAIPIRFALQSVIMTEDENNTTSIPWSYTVSQASPQYFGVSNVSKYLAALIQAAMGEVYDESIPLYIRLIPGLDDPFNTDEAIAYIQATEKEIAQFKAKDATGEVTFTARVERNTSTYSSTSNNTSDDFIIECDNETAVYENGVLTFTGDGIISVTPQNKNGGILYIEDNKGNTYTYVINVVEEHECSAGEMEIIVAPTAEYDGFAVKCCDTCEEIIEIVPLAYENCCEEHSFTNWTTVSEATETESGITTRYCTVCGYTEYQFVDYEEHVHNYSDWNVTSEATCTEAGTKTRSCTDCGEEETITISALGHDYSDEWTIDVEATCKATGSKSHHCTRCDAQTDVTEIPAGEHTLEHVVVSSSCSVAGVEYDICLICQDMFNYTVLPLAEHNYGEWTTETEASCINEGKRISSCSVCGNQEAETIPATGHTSSEIVVENEVVPSCTSNGSYDEVVYCTVCYTELSRNTKTVEKIAHSYTLVVIAPTCTTNGYTTYTCVCGDTYTANETNALGHNEVVDEAIEATCTEAGLTEGSHCEVCGEILVAQKEIVAFGHKFSEWTETKAPSYLADGEKTRVCSICNENETRPIDALIPDKTYNNEETDVSISVTDETYSGEIEVNVTPIYDGESYQVINSEIGNFNASIFDITTTIDGEKVQPEGKVLVKMPIPAGYNPKKIVVYYIPNDGSAPEKMDIIIEGNYVLFETDHFSNYAIIDTSEINATISIQSPSRTEIRNRDGIILHANVEGNAPVGSYVKWESDNSNFDKSADGSNLKILAKNKGWTTFTAILYDADGNELARDTVEMYSKSGFFDKIGGFFRSLFGTTKIYEY